MTVFIEDFASLNVLELGDNLEHTLSTLVRYSRATLICFHEQCSWLRLETQKCSILTAFKYYKWGGLLPSMETARRALHRDALPVDKTVAVRATGLLTVTVGTVSNGMLVLPC